MEAQAAEGYDEILPGINAALRAWAEAAVSAKEKRNVAWIRKLDAIALKRKKEQAAAHRSERVKNWRQALGATSADQLGSAPTQLAYRWLKGTAGWVRSPVGKAKDNNQVPDDGNGSEQADGGVAAQLCEWARQYDNVGEVPCGQRNVSILNGSLTSEPLCEQAAANAQGEEWAKWWQVEQSYDVQWPETYHCH